MKELIINGITVELDGKTKMDLQFVSFLFTSINSISAPRSWTVSLPKTAVNLGLIEGASSSDYHGNFPYQNYVVDYYNCGFRVINTGKGILTKISNRIDFVFTFGKAFEKIKLMSETKLKELTETSTDFLEWNRSINLNDMSDGFGWCNFYSFTNEDRTLTGSNADIPFSTLHPTVKFDYIMNKIQSFFGVTLVGLSALVGGCSFPIRELDGISSVFGVNNNTALRITTESSVLITFTSVNTSVFIEELSYNFIKPAGLKDCSIKINSFETISDSGTEIVSLYVLKSDGTSRLVANCLSVGIGSGKYRKFLLPFTFNMNSDDYGFQFKSNSFATRYSSSLDFDVLLNQAYYEPATTGGFFPIIPNLPDMTCADFLFEAMQLGGVFPEISDETPNTINFYSADVLFDNIGSAKDWTNKLVKSTKRMSELSEVEFKFGNYAKKNTLAYKKDETILFATDSYLVVENDNLEDESKLVELKFAAGERFSVSEKTIDYPLYDVKVEAGILIRNPKSQSNDVLAKIVNVSSVNYLQFTDDLLWSNIKLTDNYAAQQTLLNKPRYIKENFHLKPEDVHNFSAKIPIYLQQYGKYYAIMKLQYRESEFSECELLELKNA